MTSVLKNISLVKQFCIFLRLQEKYGTFLTEKIPCLIPRSWEIMPSFSLLFS